MKKPSPQKIPFFRGSVREWIAFRKKRPFTTSARFVSADSPEATWMYELLGWKQPEHKYGRKR